MDQKLTDAAQELVRYDLQNLISLNQQASDIMWRSWTDHAKMITVSELACKMVVSKAVHDPFYERALAVETTSRLSIGNSKEKDLFFALSKMLFFVRLLDPVIIQGIPREYEIDQNTADQKGLSVLTEPLLRFVFGAQDELPKSYPPAGLVDEHINNYVRMIKAGAVPMEPELRQIYNPFRFQKLVSFFGFENCLPKMWAQGKDIESQVPKNEDPGFLVANPHFWVPKKTFLGKVSFSLGAESNLAMAAFGGTAIAGLIASGVKDSPAVRVFAAAAAMGFNCSLLAAVTLKNPAVSGFLSKTGAISTASAVMLALGNTFDTVMLGKVNLNVLVMSTICALNAAIVVFGT